MPFGLYLFLNTMQLPITLRPLGNTNLQVSLRIWDFIFSMIAFFHC